MMEVVGLEDFRRDIEDAVSGLDGIKARAKASADASLGINQAAALGYAALAGRIRAAQDVLMESVVPGPRRTLVGRSGEKPEGKSTRQRRRRA